jgi:hypothetical protein
MLHAEGQMSDDMWQAATGKDPAPVATNDDVEHVRRVLQAVVDLTAELDLAFNGQDPQEGGRPIAASQLRYFRAMRAVGNFLRATGERRFQDRFYELAEALYSRSQGQFHSLFAIDDSVKVGHGRRADGHDVWRLRANLCAGIRWLIAADQTKEEEKAVRLRAIDEVVRKHRKALSKIERPGTKSLESAIGAWLDLFENPTEAEDAVAVALFRDEIEHLKKMRTVLSSAELKEFGLQLIKGVALRASKLLSKIDSRQN